MARLDAFLVSLRSLAPQIELHRAYSQKWVLERNGSATVRSKLNVPRSINWSLQWAREWLRNQNLYVAAQEEYNSDSVFRTAPEKAGYWGTFESVFITVCSNSCSITGDQLTPDIEKAKEELGRIRAMLIADSLQMTATARLAGVQLKQKNIEIESFSLLRLTLNELNKRQEDVSPFQTFEEQHIGQYRTEVSFSFHVQVEDRSSALFKAANDARATARAQLGRLRDAILLSLGGSCFFTPIRIEGNFPGIGSDQSQLRQLFAGEPLKIGRRDIPTLSSALKVLARSEDKVLSRSIDRFLLGKSRTQQLDRLVDYVIAWESLLLTTAGQSLSQELAYRFAVNGANIVQAAIQTQDSPLDLFYRFRAIYSARSAIVHGETDASVSRRLAQGGLEDVADANNFLEQVFRVVWQWLATLSAEERPFRRENGWERLNWGV